MNIYLPEDSIFLANDTRKNRWAIPYHFEAVNVRAEVLLAQNERFIKDKVVLDLGCYFGTFSKICLNLGAKKVVGVDSSLELIDLAKDIFNKENVEPEKYEFIVGDVFEFLKSYDIPRFDTVLCFGLLYYMQEPLSLLKLINSVAKQAIILDTFTAYYSVIQGKDSLKNVKKVKDETFELPLMFHSLTQSSKKYYNLPEVALTKKKSLSFLTCPTVSLLEMYFAVLGTKYTKLDWQSYVKNVDVNWRELISSEAKIASHWTDLYSAEIRVSYLLEKVN